jgi:TATA-box binding protein (TBP) (component of TFIID and TFIIIB)
MKLRKNTTPRVSKQGYRKIVRKNGSKIIKNVTALELEAYLEDVKQKTNWQPGEDILPKIPNYVMHLFLKNVSFRLIDIALNLPNSDYRPEEFAAATTRRKKTVCLIFENGKLVMSGAKSLEDIKFATLQYIQQLASVPQLVRVLNDDGTPMEVTIDQLERESTPLNLDSNNFSLSSSSPSSSCSSSSITSPSVSSSTTSSNFKQRLLSGLACCNDTDNIFFNQQRKYPVFAISTLEKAIKMQDFHLVNVVGSGIGSVQPIDLSLMSKILDKYCSPWDPESFPGLKFIIHQRFCPIKLPECTAHIFDSGAMVFMGGPCKEDVINGFMFTKHIIKNFVDTQAPQFSQISRFKYRMQQREEVNASINIIPVKERVKVANMILENASVTCFGSYMYDQMAKMEANKNSAPNLNEGGCGNDEGGDWNRVKDYDGNNGNNGNKNDNTWIGNNNSFSHTKIKSEEAKSNCSLDNEEVEKHGVNTQNKLKEKKSLFNIPDRQKKQRGTKDIISNLTKITRASKLLNHSKLGKDAAIKKRFKLVKKKRLSEDREIVEDFEFIEEIEQIPSRDQMIANLVSSTYVDLDNETTDEQNSPKTTTKYNSTMNIIANTNEKEKNTEPLISSLSISTKVDEEKEEDFSKFFNSVNLDINTFL